VSGAFSTRTETVYEAIRAELLNGVLPPGHKLRVVELATRFSASQSVVREALTRLAEQKLVVATPQLGFRVRELSIDDIAQLTEARVAIETLALRMAVERGDVHWETAVLGTQHLLERTPVMKPDGSFNEEWTVRHRDFHSALLSGCGNLHIEVAAKCLRDSAELYRRWYWALTDDHRRDLAGEHRELQELALARDAGRAVAVLTEHMTRAPTQLIEYAREHGVEALESSNPSGRRSGRPPRKAANAARKKGAPAKAARARKAT
jgi:DNA-binding GntR family transcriptional regulator